MNRIITTSELQKKVGQISKNIGEESYIVTSHGKGKIVLLPYFDGCDEIMADYIEDYEMMMNREKLVEKYKESAESGDSTLTV